MGELDGIYWHACSPTNLQNASGILSFPFSLGFCIYIYIYIHLATWYIPLELNKGWSRVTISPDLVFQDGFVWLFLRQLHGCIKAPIFMWAKVAGGIIPRDDSMELGFICCAHCGGLHVWSWPGTICYPFVFKSTLLRPFECTLHFGLNCEHNISTH